MFILEFHINQNLYLTIDHNFTIKQFWKFFYTILLKSLSKLFVISSWRMRKFSGKKNLTFQTISKQEPRTFPTYHLFTISSSPATFSSDWVIISTHIGFRVLYGFVDGKNKTGSFRSCLLYTSPSPRDGLLSRMPSSA